MPNRRRVVTAGLCSLLTLCAPVHAHAMQRAAEASTPPVSGQQAPSNGRILVVGDSLSAEYGLPRDSGWVAQIAQRLRAEDTGYQIHNASISGDTSSGGLSRLPAALQRIQPDIVIIELGANDALRGLPLDATRQNLAQMIQLVQDTGAAVVLAGMQIPPNYGPQYSQAFADIFPELADTYQTRLVPFLLEGFADRPDMFLDDGIHPNEAAQPIIAETVWEHLSPLVFQ